MREDIKKVVTERPRAGGRVNGRRIKDPKGYKKNLQDFDESPKREKIRQKWTAHYTNSKEFTDLLGPLYRYLLKQVGRPWDKVFSEISKNLPKDTLQNIHIHGHILQFVEKDVQIINGQACYLGSYFDGQPVRSTGNQPQLYINPKTGLLCKAKKGKKRNYELPAYESGVVVHPDLQYHKINGVWYGVIVRPYPLARDINGNNLDFGSIKDKVLDRYYHSLENLKKIYHGYYIAESKYQLSKRKIKEACLSE